VSVAVAYSSAQTNVLFLFGDVRITSVIEAHKEEILLNPTWTESEGSAADENQPRSAKALILPPLPGPLNELNGVTLKTIIVGLVKDLGLTWHSPKLFWWPAEFPFRIPRVAPEDYHGKPLFPFSTHQYILA